LQTGAEILIVPGIAGEIILDISRVHKNAKGKGINTKPGKAEITQ
jgi:hypothetical protein